MAKGKVPARSTGRPSIYTEELEEEIVERIAGGESILTLTKDDRMPSTRTIYNWLATKPQFIAKLKATVPAQSINLMGGALEQVKPDHPDQLTAQQAKNRADVMLKVFDRLNAGYTSALGSSKSITESQAMLRVYEFLVERLDAGDSLGDVVNWLREQLTERGMLGHESD